MSNTVGFGFRFALFFALAAAALPTVVLAGADPGLVANDQTESDLDLECGLGLLVIGRAQQRRGGILEG